MSVWSPQRVANPTPSSLCYLLLYWSLPYLPPKLLTTDSPRPPNPQDVPQALIMINTCNFCFTPLVSFQVSQPYKRTAFSFDSNTLNLVLVVSVVDRHTGLNIANACLALPMRAWMSSSVPPFLLMIVTKLITLLKDRG